jgi:hypothetical protein
VDLSPRRLVMGARIGQWTLDVRDAALMAQFWAAALG